MGAGKFERVKPHLRVGVIGHVDLSKYALTAALARIVEELPGAGNPLSASRQETPPAAIGVRDGSQEEWRRRSR